VSCQDIFSCFKKNIWYNQDTKKAVTHMEFKDILYTLRKKNKLTQQEVAEYVGLQKAAIYKYEHGLLVNPKRSLISKLAKLFQVTPSYMMGLTDDDKSALTSFHLSFTKKDEKDIQKRLSDILNDMDSQDAIAMYNGGEPMDPETREYMKASLENALRFAKLKAKEKFTPKKHRK
jgi:transcriptional regulator with XRE-family HTH domain